MAKPKPDDPELLRRADGLLDALEELERISSRAEEAELARWNDLARAGELLTKATAAHERFVADLQGLTAGVAEARDRHNRAAEGLARAAERLDAQRRAYEALEQRFASVGDAAREIDAIVKETPGDPRAGFAAVRERLEKTVADLASIGEDARAVGIVELERKADGLRQQLVALSERLARVILPEA